MTTTSETIQRIYSGDGHVYKHGRKEVRASKAYLTYAGIDLVCEYVTDGYFNAATATDPADYPVAHLKSAKTEQGRVELYELLSSQQVAEIEERIEEAWKIPEVLHECF